MYSDELEESLTEELIDIMMQDQSSTEKVKLVTIAPQLPLEKEVFRKTPSPRSSPCPSPTVFMPINNGYTEGMNYIKPDALSPHGQYHGTKYHMRNHLQQPEYLSPKLDVSTSAVRVSNSYASGISIKIEQEGSKEMEESEVESTKIEDSKETEKIKMGDRTKKSGSSSMSSLEATSFQKRLFGLHNSAAHNRKSYTLPLTSKATGSSSSSSSSSSKTSDLRRLSEPPLSPATITDSPYPPPEPMELQYFECNEVKMRHLVTKMSHTNACAATTCTELCIYIKWYANHRRTCGIVYSSKGKCDHCHQFMLWQYQHCVNCKTCPHKGCADNINWCPQIKQSILKNKLESCIAPVVRKLQNGFCADKENSCPKQNCIEKRHPEDYHRLLKEHLHFNAGGGLFVEGEHWRKNKPAGHGRAGKCWIAELMECPFYFAVKEAKLDSSVQAKRNLDEAYCSVKMKYLNQHVCPHIVDYYGFTAVRQSVQNLHCFLEPPLLLQIHMELMACCLQSFVTDKDKNGPLLFDKVVDFSYQLFSALDFLHSSLRILHRDIKPGNILVAHNEQRIKLTDFDCAALLDEWNLCDVFQGDPQGTIHYNPPELYCRGQSSWSLDVWQVACCVLFMCTGCRPWRHAYFDCDIKHINRNYVMHSITQKISTHQKHLLPGFLLPTLHSLLSKCLHSDWKNRLTPLDAMYLLDITGSPCSVSTAPLVTTQNDNSQAVAVDIYLAEYTERMPGSYLQPGWIASVSLSHDETYTYRDVKSLIYNSTELEVMRYLKTCDFYIYKNDRIKIRDLLIKELTLDQFSKMNDNDIVDVSNAVIIRYMDNTSSVILSRQYISYTVTDTIVVKNKEPCPLVDCNITSEKLTSNGGIISIEECGLKVTVPRGAIEDGCVVEIQVAASLFGPFTIPNDCRPVSAYVWIATDYIFKKLIQIEFEHHADISNLKDTSKFCMLSACCTKCNSHHSKMHDIAQDFYSIAQYVCTLFTNHFCSYCLASKSTQIPDRIVAYQYLPENYKSFNEFDEFRSELCLCYDLSICKKTTEKRFAERKMIKGDGLPIRVSLTKMDELHLSDPSRVNGWNVTHVSNKIQVHEIDFRDWYESAEDLVDDENRDHYPPRFITHLKCHQQSTLDVTYTLQVIKGGNSVKKYNFSIFVKAKTQQVASPTEIPHVVSPATLEQKPRMGCLIKFVIPNVKAHWEDVAYVVLEYDVPVVKAIERNHQNDVKGCCQELFEDWLTTEHGIKPKTWSMLLRQLREVEELTAAIEKIKEKLRELQ